MKISLLATTLQDQKGSVLVGLVFAIIIFALLGAAMLSLTSTSAVNQVWANSSSRAYYLAESGFRYAKTGYEHIDDIDVDDEIEDDRNLRWKNLHSPDPPSSPVLFTFSNNMEKFELKIYPYYFVTHRSHVIGESVLETEFSGEQPANFSIPAAGKLKIGLKIDSDPPYSYNSYVINNGTVTFSLATNLSSNISDNMNVYLVTNPSSDQNLTNGGDFTLDNALLFFPERNGVFSIDTDSTVYGYESKTGSTLHNIFDANDPGRTFNVFAQTSDDIVLTPFLKLHSTGIVDYGSSTEIRRKIVYHVPLSGSISEKGEFHDRFADKSKWEDSALGSHEIQTIGGDSALRVTDVTIIGGGYKESLIGLKWSETNVDLAAAHRLGNRYFLDYDAQVKIGYAATSPDPVWGYLPAGSSIPKYFAAGLTFRLDENINCYGLSFLRGNKALPDPWDLIDDDMVPQDDRLLVVLWQRTTSTGEEPEWLAYKDISASTPFFDRMESNEEKWTKQAPWERTNIDSYTGDYCWHDSIAGDYANNIDTSLTTKTINLSGTSEASLTFWHHYDIQLWDDILLNGDRADVEISTDVGHTTWTMINPLNPLPYSGFQGGWIQETIDLTPYVGESNVKIRFRLRTDASVRDNGWYIDDVTVSGGDFPINEATLHVRIKESASISFDSGGTSPIVDGDVIVGATSSASGMVNGTPIIASGSWAGNDAAGTILLKNVSGNFSAGEQLTVNGTLVDDTVRDPIISRANYIRAYYGDVSGYGTPNNDPFDYEKLGNPRNPANVSWAPDEVDDWSADNDYFTLVQWDDINTSRMQSNDNTKRSVRFIQSLDEPGAVIRSTEPILFTPSSGVFNRTELGLHTMGQGSLNVYFDDFALQTEIYSTYGYLPYIQE